MKKNDDLFNSYLKKYEEDPYNINTCRFLYQEYLIRGMQKEAGAMKVWLTSLGYTDIVQKQDSPDKKSEGLLKKKFSFFRLFVGIMLCCITVNTCDNSPIKQYKIVNVTRENTLDLETYIKLGWRYKGQICNNGLNGSYILLER